MAATTTVRVNMQTHRHLQQRARETGVTMPELLDHMVKADQRRRLFARANEAYATLQADAVAWDAELAERHAWDVTLGDGLDEEIVAPPRQASSTIKKVPA